MPKYPWSAAYLSAVLETDFSKMPGKIDAAERTIRIRRYHASQIGPDELRAIERTVAALQVLRMESSQDGTYEPGNSHWMLRTRKGQPRRNMPVNIQAVR
jgi:hypothetical protein